MTEAILAKKLSDGKWKPQRIPLDKLQEVTKDYPYGFLHTQNPHVIHVWAKGANGGLTEEVTILRTSGTTNREWVFEHEGEIYKVSHATGGNYRIRDL